jgi:hypothetical protein
MGIEFGAFGVASPRPPHELIAALRGGLSLFFDRPFTEFSSATREAHDLILDSGSRNRFGWYRTETMRQIKSSTARTFSILKQKLSQQKNTSDILSITYSGGIDPHGPPEHALGFTWYPKDRYAAYTASTLRLVLPGTELETHPGRLLEMTVELSTRLPVMSGLAGFTFEFAWGEETDGVRAVFPRLMRHPALDVNYSIYDATPVGLGKGIKQLGWLTVLGADLVDRLGGESKLRMSLPRDVRLHKAKYALVLQIGDAPVLGDVNRGETLPLWREVYRILSPVHEPVVNAWMQRGTKFDLRKSDENELTEAWLRRFA